VAVNDVTVIDDNGTMTLHSCPIYPALHIQVSVLLHFPCPEQTELLDAVIVKLDGSALI